MIKNLILFLSVLSLFSCNQNEGENFDSLISYLKFHNKQEIKNITLLRNSLHENTTINLLEEEIEGLIALDLSISTIEEEGNKEIINNLKDTLLTLKERIQGTKAITENLELKPSKIFNNELVDLLELESQLIELFRYKIWENYLVEDDKNIMIFSVPSELQNKDDSVTCYIGVIRGTQFGPQFSTKYNKFGPYKSPTVELKVSKEDLMKSKAMVELTIPKFSGGYFTKEIILENKIMKIESH